MSNLPTALGIAAARVRCADHPHGDMAMVAAHRTHVKRSSMHAVVARSVGAETRCALRRRTCFACVVSAHGCPGPADCCRMNAPMISFFRFLSALSRRARSELRRPSAAAVCTIWGTVIRELYV